MARSWHARAVANSSTPAYRADVEIAAEANFNPAVPLLKDGRFVQADRPERMYKRILLRQ